MSKQFFVFSLLFSLFIVSCNSPSSEKSNQETKKENAFPPLTEAEKSGYVLKGKSIAIQAYETLSGELKAAIKRGGVKEAVSYCNQNAHPILDSIAKERNVVINRTSLKTRNDNNKPNEAELAILKAYEKAIANQDIPGSIVERDAEGKTHFYAPIKIQGACLKCHGSIGTDISMDDYRIIKELYPNDLATDYKVEDWRGIWSITFNNKIENQNK